MTGMVCASAEVVSAPAVSTTSNSRISDVGTSSSVHGDEGDFCVCQLQRLVGHEPKHRRGIGARKQFAWSTTRFLPDIEPREMTTGSGGRAGAIARLLPAGVGTVSGADMAVGRRERQRRHARSATPHVESVRGAVPVLPRARFPGPLAAPGVRVSTHRALHGSCRQAGLGIGQGVGILLPR